MLTAFFEARAWRIATQVVRRAPADLTLLESTFADGFYILHSVVPRAAAGPFEAYEHRLCDVNRHGTMVSSPGRPFPSGLEEALGDPALLFDRAPRLYRDLVTHLGLPDPRPLPPSTPEVIAFRFVVAWLQLHAALGRAYACWQGVDDQGRVRAEYFGAFPQPDLSGRASERLVNQRSWHPEYSFWFLAEVGGPPAACANSSGMLYTPDGAEFDIGSLYRKSGRDIWSAVSAVRSHLERAGLVPSP